MYSFLKKKGEFMKSKLVLVFTLLLMLNHINLIGFNGGKKMEDKKRGKVTGIGGIFFKCEDPQKIKEWYRDNLGLAVDEHGSPFEFRNANRPEEINYLNWGPFSKDTKYFDPSKKEFMINYRVENIEALVEQLKESGVTIVDTIESYDYGKFVHILDSENNKIELWEPVDSVFTEYYKDRQTTK